jgi:hypothetical protein
VIGPCRGTAYLNYFKFILCIPYAQESLEDDSGKAKNI